MLEAGVLMNRLIHKTVEQPLGISNMNDLGGQSKPNNSEASSNCNDEVLDEFTSQTTIVHMERNTHETVNYINDTQFGGNVLNEKQDIVKKKKKRNTIIQVIALSELPIIIEVDEDREEEGRQHEKDET